MSAEYFFKPLGILAGVAFPFYSSFKALDAKSSESSVQWLTYWCVLALLSTFEYLLSWALAWFPFYWTLRIFFVLWLQLPQTKGAMVIYWKVLHPHLKMHEDQIDKAVQAGGKRVLRIRDHFSHLAAPSSVTSRSSSAVDKVLQELEEGDVGEKGE